VIEENHFGLCTGGTAAPPPETERQRRRKPPSPAYPLTYWLADEIDHLAGVDRQPPLTFGDLRDRNIELAMITTNLTHGRPYRLPLEFDTSFNSDACFFDPQVFAGFFPPRVIQWMVAHPPRRKQHVTDRDWQEWEVLCGLMEPRKPLPSYEDLPVVMAVRLSLSFPGLISAVPLWSVDWSRKENVLARAAARGGETVLQQFPRTFFRQPAAALADVRHQPQHTASGPSHERG